LDPEADGEFWLEVGSMASIIKGNAFKNGIKGKKSKKPRRLCQETCEGE